MELERGSRAPSHNVVQVSTDETFDDSDPIHMTVETTFTATGLPPETSVYVRVAAASGTAEAPLVGAWTSQVAGMTLPPAIPVTIPERRPARCCHRGAGQARRRSGHAPRELSTLSRLDARSSQIVGPDRPRVGDRPACART